MSEKKLAELIHAVSIAMFTTVDAQGLLLAENIDADFALPSFDNSAMDGYAVRAIDTRDAALAWLRRA